MEIYFRSSALFRIDSALYISYANAAVMYCPCHTSSTHALYYVLTNLMNNFHFVTLSAWFTSTVRSYKLIFINFACAFTYSHASLFTFLATRTPGPSRSASCHCHLKKISIIKRQQMSCRRQHICASTCYSHIPACTHMFSKIIDVL